MYVFGNEYLREDSLALAVSKELGITMIHCTSPEDLLDDDDIVILDVVKDLQEPQLIRPEQIKSRNIMSLHDFDLGFFLKLLQEMGVEKDIKIIGIPQYGDATQLAEQVKAWL